MRTHWRWLGIVALCLVALCAGPTSVGQAARKKGRPATLVIQLPTPAATLTIDGEATARKKGLKRRFSTPPLALGKRYTYKLVAKWKANVYTERIRERVVTVQAGKTVEIDMREEDPKKPDKIEVIFVPTPPSVVDAMCKLARVTKADVVYDLGCGDGIILITAVKKFGAKRGVGIDIDPDRVKETKDNAKEEGVEDRVEVRRGDILDVKDLSKADVVMLYVGTELNLRLRPILQKTLKPCARIVTHQFRMGDWKPLKTQTIKDAGEEYEIFLWKIEKKDAPKPKPK